MCRTTLSVLAAAMILAGCGGRGWMPWPTSSGESAGPGLPAGTDAWACEGGKRLLLRMERDAKSAWVIHPRGEYRLDREAAGPGERYARGRSLLTIQNGEATLSEGGRVEFARCKLEPAK